MKLNDTVKLIVNDEVFEGWTNVRITEGINQVARDFSIGLTSKWSEAKFTESICKPFDKCKIKIGDDLLLTGFICTAPIDYDGSKISFLITGRSNPGHLVECSAKDSPGQWIGQKVERIAQALAEPFKVSVKALCNTGGVIPDHQVEQGETAFQSIDKLLKLRQLLATDDAKGTLLFTKLTSKRSETALIFGENIKRGRAPHDGRDLFHKYTCKGQSSATDDIFGIEASELVGTAIDPDVPSFRHLLVLQDGQADNLTCTARATYERNLRKARAKATNYVVQGWRQDNGELWHSNLLVRVFDPINRIDREMLIVQVSFAIGEQGSECRLALMPPEAYQTIE